VLKADGILEAFISLDDPAAIFFKPDGKDPVGGDGVCGLV
jgi:hypothetical protein